MVLFNDVCKNAKGVLNCGYCHKNAWQVDLKSRSKNPNFSHCASSLKDNRIDISSLLKTVHGPLMFEGKMSSTGVGHMDVKLSPFNHSTYGIFKLASKLSRNVKMENAVDVNGEYNNGNLAHAQVNVKALLRTWTAELTTMNKLPRLPGNISCLLGCGASGSFDFKVPMKPKFGGAIIGEDGVKVWEIGMTTQPNNGNAISKITCHVWAQDKNGSTSNIGPAEVAAEITQDLSAAKTNIRVGGLWYLSEDKATSVKARVDDAGRVATVFCHKLSNSVAISMGLEATATKTDNPDMDYGLKLSLTGV